MGLFARPGLWMVVTTVATILVLSQPQHWFTVGGVVVAALAVLTSVGYQLCKMPEDGAFTSNVQTEDDISDAQAAIDQYGIVVRERGPRAISPHPPPPLRAAQPIPPEVQGQEATHQAIRRRRAALRAGRSVQIPGLPQPRSKEA